MAGDRDNPDRDYVCQSDHRDECVIPASRPDERVFSDVHIYYHGAGAETNYKGSVEVGFLEGAQAIPVNFSVKKQEAIFNESFIGAVSSKVGAVAMTIDVVATGQDGKAQPVREQVPVILK